MGEATWEGDMKLILLIAACWLASAQGYDDGMANMMSTCLDSSELAMRFMSSSVVYNDMQNAVGVCMGMRKSKKKSKKKGKEEEKKKSKKSSKKGKEEEKKKSKKTSKKPSKKEEEKPSKGKSKSKSKKGKDDDTGKSKGKSKSKKGKDDDAGKSKSKGKNKSKKGKEEEKPSKKKTSKKPKKSSNKKPPKKGTTPTPTPCQSFDDILAYFDDVSCTMELMGWADNNGTMNYTMLYDDVMSDPLLALFYNETFDVCINATMADISYLVDDSCLGDYSAWELSMLMDFQISMDTYYCWESFLSQSLVAFSKMVLGIPYPVYNIYGNA